MRVDEQLLCPCCKSGTYFGKIIVLESGTLFVTQLLVFLSTNLGIDRGCEAIVDYI